MSQTFKSMGCKYPESDESFQNYIENNKEIHISSYQIQFEISKKEAISKRIKKFINFIKSAE